MKGVIITGGASGLGAAVATAVAQAGGTPVVFDINRPGKTWQYFQTDVTSVDSLRDAVQQASRIQQIDALVCSAGIDRPGEFTEVSAADWNAVIDVNVKGVANAIRVTCDHLEASGGRIVVIGSTMGRYVERRASAYCASKFALVGLVRTLALEFAGTIPITLVMPAGMSTPFFDTWRPELRPLDFEKFLDPKHIADLVVQVLQAPTAAVPSEIVIERPI